MTSGMKIEKIAREKLGFESLRPGQKEAVDAILGGHDVLVVQPTGSGKSAIYQIAGLMIKGATVIVSPLIALQKDQVDSIQDQKPADALAAGPLAYGQQWPVLLTARDALPDVTRSALDDLGVRHVVVVGGTGVVSDAVVADLQRGGRTVERVAGADRMATATALADFMVGIGEHVTRVEVASATSFADALALGAHAAPDAPVLLCATRDECGQTTVGWIMQHTADVDAVVIAGGTSVVSQTAEAELQAAAS